MENVSRRLTSKHQGLLLISFRLIRDASELLNLGHALFFLLKNVVSLPGHTVGHWGVSNTLVDPSLLSLLHREIGLSELIASQL